MELVRPVLGTCPKLMVNIRQTVGIAETLAA